MIDSAVKHGAGRTDGRATAFRAFRSGTAPRWPADQRTSGLSGLGRHSTRRNTAVSTRAGTLPLVPTVSTIELRSRTPSSPTVSGTGNASSRPAPPCQGGRRNLGWGGRESPAAGSWRGIGRDLADSTDATDYVKKLLLEWERPQLALVEAMHVARCLTVWS